MKKDLAINISCKDVSVTPATSRKKLYIKGFLFESTPFVFSFL